MKQSMRAKRLAKHHKRFGGASKLNLVSLMDIFTILVFFLMVNQSEVRVLQSNDKIKLPVSLAEQLPAENLVVTVTDSHILVQERLVWQKQGTQGLDEAQTAKLIKALETELTYQSAKRVILTETEKQKGRAVTIMGDSSMPYSILKQIMAACANSDFRNMSLAVEQPNKKISEVSS